MTVNRKLIYTLYVLLLGVIQLQAQVIVEQRIDSVAILIGEQAHLTVDVTAPKNASIQFPVTKVPAMLVPGVEVLFWKGDTVEVDDNTQKVSRHYTITSFDEALYALPPIKIKVNGKEYHGAQNALKVLTLDVDTLHPNQFFPAKDVQDNPFKWSEWSSKLYLSILVFILLLLSAWLYLRLKQHKPIIAHIRIIKRLPPHQKALKAIDHIKAAKMQASDNSKEYYTKLTDTLRQYIEERFGFSAMEMTSSEIIQLLQEKGDLTMIQELRELFQTADLVKFAKYSTMLGENDMNLVNAINFIDKTKQENVPTEERIAPHLSESDKQERNARITIKAVLYAIAVVTFLLIVYICYTLSQLIS